MAWWVILVIVLGLYVLGAGVPWLGQWIVGRLLQRDGPFPQVETERRSRLLDGLDAARRQWPSIPRLGRFREPDQKALEHLGDLAVVTGDIDQLWPDLIDYSQVELGPTQVALFKSWPVFLRNLRTRQDQQKARALLLAGEAHLEALAMLDELVGEIPSAVTSLARERTNQATALYDRIRAEEEAGTLGLETLRERAARLRGDAASLLQQLSQQSHADDEELLRIDHELERIGAAIGEGDAEIASIVEQRSSSSALLSDGQTLLSQLRSQWQELVQQGANDAELVQRIGSAGGSLQTLEQGLQLRTPQAYAEAVTSGEALKSELVRLGDTLSLFSDTIRSAHEGVAGDVRALEDARQMLAGLQQRAIPLETDESLTLVEQAADAYRQAEERIGVGTLPAYRETVQLAARGKELLAEAAERAAETEALADRAETLLEAVDAERRQLLAARLDEIINEMGAYAVMWKSRLSGPATAAGEALDRAAELLAQLPGEVTSRQRLLQSVLPGQVELIASAQDLVVSAVAQLDVLETGRTAVLNEQQQLESGVTALRQRLQELDALRAQMLPETQQAAADVVARFESERHTMLDPEQADYEQALANWLPSLEDDLAATLQQHEEDAKRLWRAARDWRGRLDRNWRRLQSLLDRDPRRPAEDVDQLYQAFEEWWDRAEGAEGQVSTLAELVDVQAVEIDARIQRAIGQLDDGRRQNRDLLKEVRRRRRDVERLREDVSRLATEGGWPGLAWDMRGPDDLWRRMSEAESSSMGMPTIDHANGALQQALSLAGQAEEAYDQLRDTVTNELATLGRVYRETAQVYDEVTQMAADLRAQGPSTELTALESRLDAARRDLDAAREATSVSEATQRLELARETLGPALS